MRSAPEPRQTRITGAGGACSTQIQHKNTNTEEEHDSEQKPPADSTRPEQTALGVTTVTRQLTSHRSYIVIAYFAVLNVVTGTFCQAAIEAAERDPTLIAQH
ncbi:MAG: hypothetical protein VXW27_10120, partial [Pseudomonadota bacterium]|nr:hypothetical protein [Pseudomonadota bacterium]